MNRGQRGVAIATILLSALTCRSAEGVSATDADYDINGSAWNGLSYLLQTAREADVDLEVVDEVKLDRLGPNHVLFWIHPRVPLPTAPLLAFVASGGRLIVADDVGSAGPLLKAIGVTRHAGASETHSTQHGPNPQLPIVRGNENHFTLYNVREGVVANHPARVTGSGTPVLSYEGADEEHLALEIRKGRGSVLIIADPSIFITQMLRRFYGNKQFAANVLRVYLERPRNRLLLALPTTTITGTYGRLGPLPDIFRTNGEKLNSLLASLNTGMRSRPWPHVLTGVLLLLGIALLRVASVRTMGPSLPPVGSQLLPSTSPRDMHKRALLAGREHADFSEAAHSLVTEGIALADAMEAPSEICRAAQLRIQDMAASLRSSKLLRVQESQFLSLAEDVKLLRDHSTRSHDGTS